MKEWLECAFSAL